MGFNSGFKGLKEKKHVPGSSSAQEVQHLTKCK